MALPRIAHRFADVDGLRVFFREAGPADITPILLLHGFPSASHQFRRLFDALGTWTAKLLTKSGVLPYCI